MPKDTRPTAPRIDEIVLADLVDGELAELAAGDRVDGLRYRGGDISERG